MALLYTPGWFLTHKNEQLKVNGVVGLVTHTQRTNVARQDTGHRIYKHTTTNTSGNSASECLRSESAAITGNTKKTINQSHRNPGLEAKKRKGKAGFETERHEEKLRKTALA